MSADRLRELSHRRGARWELDDCKTLLSSAFSKVDPLAEYLAATFALGLRPVEAQNLQWTQVDFRSSLVQLPRSRTSRSLIPVPLGVFAASVLLRRQARQAADAAAAGKSWSDDGGRIFTSECGDPLNSDAVIRHVHALCREADLPLTGLVRVRNSIASWLQELGASQFETMAFLRLASPIPGHDEMRHTAALLDKVFFEDTTI